jgi:hypothetical protein
MTNKCDNLVDEEYDLEITYINKLPVLGKAEKSIVDKRLSKAIPYKQSKICDHHIIDKIINKSLLKRFHDDYR